jgi:hypothetical protein
MIQFCMFGGHTGQFEAARRIHITIFGGCDLIRPTIAKQVSAMKQQGGPQRGGPSRVEHFFATIFGGTTLRLPTLAAELLDLQNALRSGELTLADWDRLSGALTRQENISTLTLFGGFDSDELPGEDKELEDLALNRHLGYISEDASDVLMQAIGHRGPSRAAAARQAASLAAAQTVTA